MPRVVLPRITLYYEEWKPDADNRVSQYPILFLHGFTLDRRMWRPQVDYFKERYHVLAKDSRGHGLSDAPKTDYSRADRVHDLHDFVDQLGIEKVHLVGLSMGGSTALGFALAHGDRLATLTLISTGAAGYSPGKKFEKLTEIAKQQGIKTTMKRWKDASLGYYRDRNPEIMALMKAMMDDHTGAPWLDPMRGQYPRTYDLDRAGEIKTPTLILTGELDRIFVPLAEKLHAEIPNSRLHLYEDVGHMLNLEAPQRCNRDIEAFLTEFE